jgi:hypothetical protein
MFSWFKMCWLPSPPAIPHFSSLSPFQWGVGRNENTYWESQRQVSHQVPCVVYWGMSFTKLRSHWGLFE